MHEQGLIQGKITVVTAVGPQNFYAYFQYFERLYWQKQSEIKNLIKNNATYILKTFYLKNTVAHLLCETKSFCLDLI